MLIRRYQTEYVRPPNPNAQHLRCFAHVDGDLGEILPYLNAVLGGHQFFTHPPSLTLKHQAKLITLTPGMIAINIVKGQREAEGILEWLRQVINDTWERRQEIQPRFDFPSKPHILDILRMLPKTNCGQCGQPTCMVFATQASEGHKGPGDCPPLDGQDKEKLLNYLKNYKVG